MRRVNAGVRTPAKDRKNANRARAWAFWDTGRGARTGKYVDEYTMPPARPSSTGIPTACEMGVSAPTVDSAPIAMMKHTHPNQSCTR